VRLTDSTDVMAIRADGPGGWTGFRSFPGPCDYWLFSFLIVQSFEIE
jgi:hypothetical protein